MLKNTRALGWSFSLFTALTVAVLQTSCGSDEAANNQPGTVNAPTRGLWVTYDVQGDTFKAVVVEENAVRETLEWVQTGEQPNGNVQGAPREGTEFNAPYSWHLEPESVQYVQNTAAITTNPAECSAKPSVFEKNFQDPAIRERCPFYTPGNSKIVEVRDCRSGSCQILTGPTPTPTATSDYNPCAGKACGDSCQICPPNDPNCVETQELKQCTAQGECRSAPASCSNSGF